MVIEQTLTLNSTNVDDSLDPTTEWATTMDAVNTGDQVVVKTESNGTTQIFPFEIYQAVADSVTSYPPATPSEWVRVGASNAHKMFDGKNNSRTIATHSTGNIVTEVVPKGRPKFVYLYGLRNVTKVEVDVSYTHDGSPRTDTFESDLLISYSAVGFYSWLFDIKSVDRAYRSSAGFFIPTVPAPPNEPTITVTLYGAPDISAECAQLIIGTGFWLGDTEWGVEPTLRDYSTFEANDWGDKVLVPRQNTREISGTLWVNTQDYDRVFQIFESRINQLALFDFNNGDEISSSGVKDALRVYGKLSSISGGLKYNKTPINLKIEGNS
ncbi:MAG: hypothetical protein VBE63_15380 [Lamprobacter sp.]|uniref:hypothetical protein n=1 Tax=Lamprobacter sp. TaxID=3100796 RepID=UPI002B263900|nr:hypothetical protein [Lamprobacter sp.]MEA3641306.1 hypothetical protein [Lamprobacter sp.]